MFEDLVRRTRSIRRFHQGSAVATETLKDLINMARLSASAANLQPLKYMIANTPDDAAKVFPALSWAAYLKDWPGPDEGQRPSAYIIMLGDTSITKNFHCDHGIAAQTIMLGAAECGLGGCIIGSVNKRRLRADMDIPAGLEILLVLALGKPNEKVMIEQSTGDIRYWRDEKGVHHVPKRSLDEIIIR